MTADPRTLRERVEALADEWKADANKAAVRSTTDPNAYLRMTIYERVERLTRALLAAPEGGWER